MRLTIEKEESYSCFSHVGSENKRIPTAVKAEKKRRLA